jgi:hypothetical protein
MGTNGSGQLHLTQAWSVFMIVASGAAVALLLAAGEMLYYRRIYTRECTGVRLYITYVHHLCTSPMYITCCELYGFSSVFELVRSF